MDGWRQGVRRVRLAAPPVEGLANDPLVRLLAHALGVLPRDVPIPRGTPRRDKLVEVDDITEEKARWLETADMNEGAGAVDGEAWGTRARASGFCGVGAHAGNPGEVAAGYRPTIRCSP